MFVLALALGKSIRELTESMDNTEFFMWWNYYSERPFGDIRADYRMALNTQLQLSPHLKESRPLENFKLSFRDSTPTDEELYSKLTGIFGNGK